MTDNKGPDLPLESARHEHIEYMVRAAADWFADNGTHEDDPLRMARGMLQAAFSIVPGPNVVRDHVDWDSARALTAAQQAHLTASDAPILPGEATAAKFLLPVFDVGAHVRIRPLEEMAGRVVEIVRTAEEGWIYVVRYIADGEAKTMKCFPDEVDDP